MRWIAPLVLSVATLGCHQPPAEQGHRITDPKRLARLKELPLPEAFARPQDQEAVRRLRAGFEAPMPCGDLKGSWSADQCFRFEKPRRWTGLWRNEFEGLTFCPAPARECPGETLLSDPHRPIYGNMELRSEPRGWRDTPPGGLYAVEFIGRRSEYGLSGGTSGADKQVIVDRWISIRQIEPPPPQPTKAEMVEYWKKCEAAATCIPNWDEINKTEE